MRPVLLVCSTFLLGPLCAGCRATFASPEEVPAGIEHARQLFAEGETEEALEILRDASEVQGLDPDTRDEVGRLTEQFADRRIQELSGPGSDADDLEDLLDLDLPRQLAVTAGVRAARLYLDDDEPGDAFDLLRRVDRLYPTHHERAAAGNILAEAGFQLAADPGSFLGLFRKRDDAVDVLEYLVLTYPANSRCDEAYYTLGAIYEEQKDWPTAREQYEDLLLYHPESIYASSSAARIPHLRLVAVDSPEYDRRELVLAREELEIWLSRHPGSDDAVEVRIDYADSLQRLARGDLAIARFYKRIDNGFGARYHVGRALEEARASGEEDLIAEVLELLDRIPEVEDLPSHGEPRQRAGASDEADEEPGDQAEAGGS